MTLDPKITHKFEPYDFGPLVICIHLQGGGVCGRSEDDHEPTEDTEPTENLSLK